jgi:hypothetical protein
MPKLSNNVALYEAALNSVNPPFASSWQLGDMEGWGAKAFRGVAGRAFKMRRKPAFGSVVGIAHAIGKGGYARRRRGVAAVQGRASKSRGFASAIQRAGLHGLEGNWFTDTVAAVGSAVGSAKSTVEAKGAALENALKIIMALSGVAALTGVVNLVRR